MFKLRSRRRSFDMFMSNEDVIETNERTREKEILHYIVFAFGFVSFRSFGSSGPERREKSTDRLIHRTVQNKSQRGDFLRPLASSQTFATSRISHFGWKNETMTIEMQKNANWFRFLLRLFDYWFWKEMRDWQKKRFSSRVEEKKRKKHISMKGSQKSKRNEWNWPKPMFRELFVRSFVVINQDQCDSV